MKNVMRIIGLLLIMLVAVSCQTTTQTAGDTPAANTVSVPANLEPGDISTFEVIAASQDGRLKVEQVPGGAQLSGKASFGNFAQYNAMVPIDGLEIDLSLEYLEDNNLVDNWFAIGVLSRQGFLNGDEADTSTEGFVFLARKSVVEGDTNVGFQILKNPGLQELATLTVPYSESAVYDIKVKAGGEGYLIAIGDQRAVLKYEDVAGNLFRNGKGFLFFSTHSDSKSDLKGTVRRINSTTFVQGE